MATTFELDIGDSFRSTNTFRDINGDVFDPTVVRYKLINPAGTVTTLVYGTDAAVVKVSVGMYYVNRAIPLAKASAGYWFSRWEGEASASPSDPLAADDIAIKVASSPFFP